MMRMKFGSIIERLRSYWQKLSQEKQQQQLSSFVFDNIIGDREYYVAFLDPEETYFAQGLFKPGFRHCFIFFRGDNCWLMLNPTRWFLHIMELSCLPEDPFPSYLKASNPEITILKLTCRLQETKLMYFRPLTCVSHTAYILGLTKRFLITPYQLFNCLLKGNNPNITHVQEIIV